MNTLHMSRKMITRHIGDFPVTGSSNPGIVQSTLQGNLWKKGRKRGRKNEHKDHHNRQKSITDRRAQQTKDCGKQKIKHKQQNQQQ